ncbi:hypothetical protein [Amycolatopsis magusensis]|uniref:hypothetical protein n=1 Tax=Amycolatopsis magusensis TaxID=882444 RepID=UPI0024A9A985|nr:hypothetical protein [Amycolatopsis magusensis]MDI5979649.1 hypothetical protein [Amycolatopsis magusensis]
MVRHTRSFTLRGDASRAKVRNAPAHARTLLRDLLCGCPDAVVDDALLLVDELLTDVVRAPATLRAVRLAREDSGAAHLSVEVDYFDHPVLAPGRPSGDVFVGRCLLERLAASWGVRCSGAHRTVWARFPLDRG